MVDVCMIVANAVTRDPRVQKEARALVQAGYSVTVIGLTAGDDPEWEDAPGGYRIRRVAAKSSAFRTRVKRAIARRAPGPYQTLIKEYRRLRGIYAVPAAAPPEDGKSGVYRSLEGSLRAHADRIGPLSDAAILTLPRVIHCHDLDVLEAGARAARWTGAALVFDSHELWWAQFPDEDTPPAWRTHYQDVEARLIREVDGVITVCDSIADFLADRYPGLNRPLVVRNALDVPNLLRPEDLHPTGRPVEVLFHGGLSPGRGLEQLVEAARGFVGATLVVRGFGPLEAPLRAQVEREGLGDRVRFDPPVPMSEVVAAASTADIGIIPYRAVCMNNRFSTPNKLFEYMAAGLAIAASDLPEIRRVVQSEDVGAVFDAEDPASISAAVNALAADPVRLLEMRRRSVTAVRDRLNWTREVSSVLDLYRTLLPRSRLDAARAFVRSNLR